MMRQSLQTGRGIGFYVLMGMVAGICIFLLGVRSNPLTPVEEGLQEAQQVLQYQEQFRHLYWQVRWLQRLSEMAKTRDGKKMMLRAFEKLVPSDEIEVEVLGPARRGSPKAGWLGRMRAKLEKRRRVWDFWLRGDINWRGECFDVQPPAVSEAKGDRESR